MKILTYIESKFQKVSLTISFLSLFFVVFSKMKFESNLTEESNASLGAGATSAQPAAQKQKYIPPACRSSDGSTAKTRVSDTSNKQKGSNGKRERSSPNSSPQRPLPSPSPIGLASGKSNKMPNPVNSSQQNKSKKEEVEVWQEKRRGGNRAPKIEPAGTKNWRIPKPKVHRKIILLKRGCDTLCLEEKGTKPLTTFFSHMGNKTHDPLSRWPQYPSVLLDVIDIHLNVLIQCISPGEAKLSLRCGPTEAPKCPSFHIPRLLPQGISKQDFQNLVNVILNGILKLPLSALEYLVKCEQEVGRRGWPAPREWHSQLYGLAAAQINVACATNILKARFTELSEEQKRDLLSRQYLLAQEEVPIMNYMLKHSTSNLRNSLLMVEMEQLVQDWRNGSLSAEHLGTWNTCIWYQWLGKVQALPDYLALLQTAGFDPGKRIPAQIVHPREPSRIFDTIAAWMERIKMEKLHGWSYPFPSLKEPPYLNTVEWKEQVKQDSQREEYCVDFAKSLSLNRNWRNQFTL